LICLRYGILELQLVNENCSLYIVASDNNLLIDFPFLLNLCWVIHIPIVIGIFALSSVGSEGILGEVFLFGCTQDILDFGGAGIEGREPRAHNGAVSVHLSKDSP
jgi:hypothetical protein